MIVYILQAILFQLLFLLVYEVMLKKETFFSYNRWYLLITALVSFLLPLIKIEPLSLWIPAESLTQMSTILLPEVFIGNAQPADQMVYLPAVEISSSAAVINPYMVIYFLGLFTALVVVLKKYNNLSRMFRFKKIAAEGRITIIEVPDSSIACTFYRTIFLGDKLSEAEKQQILSHEFVHVRQNHSLDLVFFEVLKVIFWFNPLIYIYQNRIATVHEFIADAAVVKVTEKKSYYEQLLNSAFNTQNISFINQFFNHSLIKKRIVMLQRSRSKTILKAKYFIVFPIILAMLTIVACSESILPSGESNPENYNYTLVKGNEQSSEKDAENYLNFLAENHGYVGWKIVDHEKEIIEYSIHPKNKEVPADYKRLKYFLPNGRESIHYVKEVRPYANTAVKIREVTEGEGGLADIPFAVVEQVPVFPGCESLATNEEKKKCMSEKISQYVNINFDTSLGKKLGLKGVNRVITVFKISPEGNITNVRARAPHPDLEAEAIRVVGSLPKMIPGVHNGNEVGVSYALPIVLNINE